MYRYIEGAIALHMLRKEDPHLCPQVSVSNIQNSRGVLKYGPIPFASQALGISHTGADPQARLVPGRCLEFGSRHTIDRGQHGRKEAVPYQRVG